jgi:hypothetical protein
MIFLLEKNIIEKEVTFFIIVSYMILDDIRRRNIWNIMFFHTTRI